MHLKYGPRLNLLRSFSLLNKLVILAVIAWWYAYFKSKIRLHKQNVWIFPRYSWFWTLNFYFDPRYGFWALTRLKGQRSSVVGGASWIFCSQSFKGLKSIRNVKKSICEILLLQRLQMRQKVHCTVLHSMILCQLKFFYILIMDEKVLVLCEKWLSKFSSNLYVSRPPESEKMVFTKVSVCPSVCLSVCLSVGRVRHNSR